ncbi:MAG: ABC transporter ATP-binding protein [Elusimicrobiales bacterium]|nr:ABC transporter ATP-binding protein [Elusimicrobiales bacterium]
MKYLIKWLFPYWKKHKYRMLLIITLGIISAALQALIPLYIKQIINGFEKNLTVAYIEKNVLIMLGLGVISFVVNVFAQRNRAYMNYRTEYEIREKLFNHILNLDEYLFLKYSVGEVLTRLVDDISEKIAWFSCSGVFRFVQSFFTLIAIISVMLYLNVELTIICLIPMPFMVYGVVKMGKVLTRKYDDLQKAISNVYDYIETSFSGVKVIKANLREKSFASKFSSITSNQMDKAVEAEKKQIFINYIFFGTAFFVVFIVYLVGGSLVIENKLTVGALVSFQIYASMLIWPFGDVSQFFISSNRARVSAKRVDEILNFKSSLLFEKKSVELKRIERVELKNISFSIGDKKLLENINIDIKTGQKIAVVGRIGSSKTMLLKIISRILQYSSGHFYVNGIDVKDFEPKIYQSRLSYVSQEAAILSDTVLNNITMYKNYSEKDLKNAIEISQLERDISLMPHGLNTVVGNKGVTLSGGQKQRISLARALIKSPDILVMDDATNQMDAETEHKFWSKFLKCFNNTMVIFVTHRTSTIERSDEVFVMDAGRIVERGNHKDLISKDSLYKKIYTKYKLENK